MFGFPHACRKERIWRVGGVHCEVLWGSLPQKKKKGVYTRLFPEEKKKQEGLRVKKEGETMWFVKREKLGR